jgi:glycine/D-amino acid oxidase-like deaminating enzyme
LRGRASADLAIVGGGLTGLWCAILAKQENPSLRVVLLEGRTIAHGASGRNGGFISESLTHGLAHGVAMWPNEIETLLRLGRENFTAIEQTLKEHAIDADLRRCGKSVVALTTAQVSGLQESLLLHQRFGEDSQLLDGQAMRADINSPTYLAGLRVRSGGGLVDPVALCWGLLRLALGLGVVIHEQSPVVSIHREGHRLRLTTRDGSLDVEKVVLATNAYRSPLRRLRSRLLPVYDHVLVTEPLSEGMLASIGWAENQGVTDGGNQFHYYRRTPDNRILWGGYDAIYYYGSQVAERREQRAASHRLIAQHFFATFPQLEDIRFTHRWAGVIDSTSRFTPTFGTAYGGRLAYAVGYTGLGVGASRFGALVALDLLGGEATERTELEMVRKKPVPFPPEPARWLLVQATRAALAREDRTGNRGAWLRTLDRMGVGFNS